MGMTINIRICIYFPFSHNIHYNNNIQDDGLAQLATDYSESCIFGHSGWDTDDLSVYAGITSFELPPITAPSWEKALGENLAFSTLTPVVFTDTLFGCCGIVEGVQGWIDEGPNYDYGTIPTPTPSPTDEVCVDPNTCGHFTQV